MKITVETIDPAMLAERGVKTWPVWEKEVSEFPWSYDSVEECFLLEGEVEVTCGDGEKVAFGAGDFVTFPKGLSCTWKVKKPVRKHYNFK